MKKYFYNLLHKYLSVYILPEDTVIEVEPSTDILIQKFSNARAFLKNENQTDISNIDRPENIVDIQSISPDYILMSGQIHYERDIQSLFENIHRQCSDNTRLIITYYSTLWKPLMKLATKLGLRSKLPEVNWIAHEDMSNFLLLSGFEPVRIESRVLLPVYIPFISNFVNRYFSPLPFFRIFNLVNILVARPLFYKENRNKPGVSVIVPSRNESGNIEDIIKRLPMMSKDDELIFIEGNSTDDTWEKIQNLAEKYGEKRKIIIAQQDGKGKGDAVRKGFNLATKDILMILDADMTVPPEDLPRFYNAVISGKGEFINGSRLVYPMEKQAMRFFNMLGNKFFAIAFSFVLGQRFKDTLCGTKVISRENYLKLSKHRAYFGDFDPFGDFDLIFGAARLCLKIVEVPIIYRERTYGTTNISRWRHGAILLKMLLFAARKIKFI